MGIAAGRLRFHQRGRLRCRDVRVWLHMILPRFGKGAAPPADIPLCHRLVAPGLLHKGSSANYAALSGACREGSTVVQVHRTATADGSASFRIPLPGSGGLKVSLPRRFGHSPLMSRSSYGSRRPCRVANVSFDPEKAFCELGYLSKPQSGAALHKMDLDGLLNLPEQIGGGVRLGE